MKLYDLLRDVEYTVVREGNPEISDIIYDSRKVSPGTVFAALKGAAADGHKYACSAIDKGAAALVISDDLDFDIPDGVAVVKTGDTRLALALMSRAFFNYPERELKTVAITGTKGKTTTAAMIAEIFEQAGIKAGTIGTLGIVYGGNTYKTDNTTPESYEIQKAMRNMADAGVKAFVIEASSIGLKASRLAGMTFDAAVFTNFSNDHIGGVEHKDMAEYLYCKSLLFRQCRNAAANIDDPAWEKITADFKGDILTYGFSEGAKLRAKNDRLLSDNGFIGVHFETEGLKNLSPDVGVPGKFNAYNALAAISAVSFFDIPDKAILDGLKIAHVKGRVEPVKVPGNYSLLIDYAHNALSMENVLTTLRQYKPNRLITMFGAGGNRPKVRRYEMGETSGRLSDLSVITEDNSRFEDVMDIIADIKTGLHKTDGKYVVVPKRKEAIRYCMLNAQDGDIIVLAGKGHEDYQEIKGVKYHMDERELIAEIIEEEGL
ncbi:UDP-N-acetylmuramoyl-L-alanyl-D-glutamate--2,6-diaminopimelate ligase [Lachnoclostridium sp. MSJ-17]|uniref:UDP-N-acetylmuramoyl-L-alanyl-D-glutamate--2, 6-diaminopimelate ligase n=1 Tax=Lachnoclostridium sp. MSJ-17 TaxID=2841516 RepID=UPI001C0FDC6F|nr:UDP-N-acetylmuramoyl-L-alanyl-D-glutamate--2,6-diaminopimelate ligase [Lachnoclostridium sp. MSJ-17]MBU5461943.1 UDP-N-acetylmuramoyl-L-alanyl-D-glutamate--2,6-diaminopimelate ligase [Lachnoclostridium sp. MSJ-17]